MDIMFKYCSLYTPPADSKKLPEYFIVPRGACSADKEFFSDTANSVGKRAADAWTKPAEWDAWETDLFTMDPDAGTKSELFNL
jgi:hypothetical protein